MRVGLVIYDSLKALSGGYLYDRKVVEHLRVNGDEVEVFSIPWRSYSRHLIDNLSSYWLERLVRARLDLLLEDELNHPSLFLLNRRLRPRVSYPIISIVHHLRCREQWPLTARTFYRAVEQQYLASVDAFVFNSKATRCSVEELLGGAGPGVIAHPGGDRLGPALDEREIVARVRRGGPLRLVFVGNLIPRKGLHGLLAALAAVKEESWELSVVGSLRIDLDYVARIRGSIAAFGLKDRVRLLGFGLPALACRSGGAGEIVTHGENGYLLEPGDIGGLAILLRRLIKDRDELLRLSLAALRRFATFPTWEQTAAKIRAFLLEAACGTDSD
jgi:glycosyltransferase involved in cell wall biosynthesis